MKNTVVGLPAVPISAILSMFARNFVLIIGKRDIPKVGRFYYHIIIIYWVKFNIKVVGKISGAEEKNVEKLSIAKGLG